MIRNTHVVAHFILMLNLVGGFDVQPPRDVKIVKSKLQWKPPSDNNVLYSVQYKLGSEPVDEWHNVSGHTGTKLQNFEITNEFYGARFRVRAEKEGYASQWQTSNPVQCVNLNYCIPLMTVNVKPATTFLSMTHMDESLENEYGVYIGFNISFWKVIGGGHSEVQFHDINYKHEVFRNLESGQTYCFQVQYLLYHKPYGNTSEQQCVIIPSNDAYRHALLTTIPTTVIVLIISACCIFALFKNHKKFKQILRPPVEIPEHFREFLSQEFPQQQSPSPSIQSLQSCDVITLIENVHLEETGQERRS